VRSRYPHHRCWPRAGHLHHFVGKKLRLTRLGAGLAPVIGSATTGVTDGFVTVKVTPVYDDGENIQLKNADGKFCINEKGEIDLAGADLEIAFCGLNPDYVALITGQSAVLDYDGAATGIRLQGGVTSANFGLEVWTGVAGMNGLAWGYLLLPALGNAKVGEILVQNGAVNLTITCTAKENPGWGVGPYNVVGTGEDGDVPGKLAIAAGPKTFVHLDLVTVAPPAATNGLVALAA
jgi:hypothetical protein